MTTDILFDRETGDIRIENGDLVIGDSVTQHIEDLLIAEKGFFKFDPEIGVGLNRYTNDDLSPEDLIRLIRLELEKDGMKINKILISNDGKIEIDGNY
jgi:hypothetical protein